MAAATAALARMESPQHRDTRHAGNRRVQTAREQPIRQMILHKR
jgi:hypothetical protein